MSLNFVINLMEDMQLAEIHFGRGDTYSALRIIKKYTKMRCPFSCDAVMKVDRRKEFGMTVFCPECKERFTIQGELKNVVID